MTRFQLGKRPAKRDARNFKLASILKKKLALPVSYDCDTNLGVKIKPQKFANDSWGDCVVASRAHQTLRFEYFEQKEVLPITDDEVLAEYWLEQGDITTKNDEGLVVLDSLNSWRKQGWKVHGEVYDIYAFAEIDRTNHEEVKTGIRHLNGACVGLLLPTSAQCQFTWYLRWNVSKWCDSEPGSLGGHCVYLVGYDSKGPICLTWGRKQKMSWAFFDKFCDEAYCIVDNRDNFVEDSPVDVEVLDGYLQSLK